MGAADTTSILVILLAKPIPNIVITDKIVDTMVAEEPNYKMIESASYEPLGLALASPPSGSGYSGSFSFFPKFALSTGTD